MDDVLRGTRLRTTRRIVKIVCRPLANCTGRRPVSSVRVHIVWGWSPLQVEEAADGSFVVTTEAGAQVPCDKVMYATGRKPYIQNLGLEDVGVELNERDGAIKVDEYSKTNVDSIYAVG